MLLGYFFKDVPVRDCMTSRFPLTVDLFFAAWLIVLLISLLNGRHSATPAVVVSAAEGVTFSHVLRRGRGGRGSRSAERTDHLAFAFLL